MKFLHCLSAALWAFNLIVCMQATRPNIVIIIADDLGFDDVSFRGSNEFLTPNIDALAYSGVILKNFYVASMCTPSRSALLTGKYPIHTGMQHYVITNCQPWGLLTNETTMGEIFQRNGYYTSLIGKWHLGMAHRAMTPTFRGFHRHYGYLGAYIDYYDQTLTMFSKNLSRGHDFRDNLVSTRDRVGTYVTDLLTEAAIEDIEGHNYEERPLLMLLNHLAPHSGNDDHPLQAPVEEINKFSYIKDERHRTYAAMVSLLDKSVGQVVDALSRRGVLNDTIILFFSDNGGPTTGMHATTASNYPLRGQKNSPWEGGIRSSGAIWSLRLNQLGRVWHQNFYIADLLPTLASAAGIELDSELALDGIDLWSALQNDAPSLDREVMHNWDPFANYVAYMSGNWKFITGTTADGRYDGWYGYRVRNSSDNDPRSRHYEEVVRSTSVWQQLNTGANINLAELRAQAGVTCSQSNIVGMPCRPLEAPCLFNLAEDPCEKNNLFVWYRNTELYANIKGRIDHFKSTAHQPNNRPDDRRSNPGFHNGEWTWWLDELESGTEYHQLIN